MSNVIEFPGKDARQWAGVAGEFRTLFAHLGATDEEATVLLARLQSRWEQLGAPMVLKAEPMPGPLSPEQSAAFENALRSQASQIVAHQKKEHAQTLFDFARLEFELLRKS
jgi:hypothetical protein